MRAPAAGDAVVFMRLFAFGRRADELRGTVANDPYAESAAQALDVAGELTLVMSARARVEREQMVERGARASPF